MLVCSECDFAVQMDGGESEAELQEMSLQIERMHARQRHNETTRTSLTFQTSAVPGRPGRPN